jgi:hypothetical protein
MPSTLERQRSITSASFFTIMHRQMVFPASTP